ncbi:MAG: DNA primase [Desulfobaccales bacterium]
MAPYIPEDKLLEIKEAAAIDEVVGQYVKLTRRGRNLVGLCPFHPDSKPSFTVSPERGIFYCFGCGAGGNVISFLMQHLRLSFPEAVEELARRYHIPLNLKDVGPEGARQAKRRRTLQDLNTEAAAFYQRSLAGPGGAPAREYLARRGLTAEVVEAYQLGYAPPEWEALSRHLQGKGFPLELAVEAGLVLPRASGGVYDRFRDRVMFPIHDRQGRVVAFGGRILGEGEPKYLNSPESPLFAKGRLLYGLPQAAAALRRDDLALVVEGYLDLLSLRVHGVEPVVATLGTALTREHVRLLKSQVSRVVLVFDGDAAGARAMLRAFPLFAAESLAVRVLVLPAGQDPDDYVRAHGPELFRRPWEAAQPWFSYLLETLLATYGREVEGVVRLIAELKPYLAAVADPVEQDLWLRQAAARLGVEEASLRRSLAQAVPPAASRLLPAQHLSVSLERNFLKWILSQPEAVSLAELEEWAGDFEAPELRELMERILAVTRRYGHLDLSLLLEQVEEDGRRQLLLALAFGEEEFDGVSAGPLREEWRHAFLRRRLKKMQAQLKEQLARAAADPAAGDLMALQLKKQEVDRQLAALREQGCAGGESG